jgi:hypothetical protein
MLSEAARLELGLFWTEPGALLYRHCVDAMRLYPSMEVRIAFQTRQDGETQRNVSCVLHTAQSRHQQEGMFDYNVSPFLQRILERIA